ncbi:DUF397 domain-containing protein [Streptomyces sp. NPDC006692]|uniref:DUF397 domain-containing protein n=1 Tax=unclassified Streptomyces TaxID=2593676 RepID=UPI00369C503C
MADSTTTQHTLQSVSGHTRSGWDKPELDLSKAEWQSSSQGAGDVQIAFVEGFIAMRNSGSPGSPSLIFSPGEWRAFVLNARDGEFDLT